MTLKRIKEEAEKYTKDEGYQKAYIAGATALNDLAQGLVDALESLLEWHTDGNLLPLDSLIRRIEKAKEELAKWKGEVENG